MNQTFTFGFLPLVDAALPILARELGFAEDEGLRLELVRDLSWSTALDRLAYGHADAAQLVAPLAIAAAIGRGRPRHRLVVPFLLGFNGNAVTLLPALAREVHCGEGLGDPAAVGAALARVAQARKAEGRPLVFGVVHRYSSHNIMLRYWLASCGIRPDEDVEIWTVPPPFCADALAQGDVDGICVGEPWNSVAVDRGAGEIVLATTQIWPRGIEKVVAVPERIMADRPQAVLCLLRALRRAAVHFADPGNREACAAILAKPAYLDGDAAVIGRAIGGGLVLRRDAEPAHCPRFLVPVDEAANFPWQSQAAWIYGQMTRWDRQAYDPAEAARAAAVFRPDVYRAAFAGTAVPLPVADSRIEGGGGEAATSQGTLCLPHDRFFDGRTFDPAQAETYLSGAKPSGAG